MTEREAIEWSRVRLADIFLLRVVVQKRSSGSSRLLRSSAPQNTNTKSESILLGSFLLGPVRKEEGVNDRTVGVTSTLNAEVSHHRLQVDFQTENRYQMTIKRS
jgi:hypothetical protein